jgi:hypothetical protein
MDERDTFKPAVETLDGICRRLRDAFGECHTIYTESVKQGLCKPCFFVKAISLSSTNEPGGRFLRTHRYCIHYFPSDEKEPENMCIRTLDMLYPALELIEVRGCPIRGIDLHGELHDGALLFYAEYNVFARYEDYDAMMKRLEGSGLGAKS